jgi:hypothetical protein
MSTYRTPFDVLQAIGVPCDLVTLAQRAGLLDAAPTQGAPMPGFSSVVVNPPFVAGNVTEGDTDGQDGLSVAA